MFLASVPVNGAKDVNGDSGAQENFSATLHECVDNMLDARYLTVFDNMKLGEGTFGLVLKGVYDSTPCAVKLCGTKVNNPTVKALGGDGDGTNVAMMLTERETNTFFSELVTTSRLQHENIVRIMGLSRYRNKWVCVMPVYRCSLHDVAVQNLDPYRRVRILLQIARAMEFANNKGILHLDLKPNNVLMDSSLTPHVADFGIFARVPLVISNRSYGVATGTVGELMRYAPELFANFKMTETKCISSFTDVYAFGAVIMHTLFGQAWYGDKQFDWHAAIAGDASRIVFRKRPSTVFHPLVLLALQCYAWDAYTRPRWKHIIAQLEQACAIFIDKDPTAALDSSDKYIIAAMPTVKMSSS